MKVFEQTYNIDYCDVGEKDLLTNKGFLKFMQGAASIHSEIFGYGVNDTPKTRVVWILNNWKLNILKRPTYNEKIFVKTWVRKIEKICFYRDFEIKDESKKIIATGTSRWVLFNIDTKKIQKVTDEILKKNPTKEKEAIPSFEFPKLKACGDIINKFKYKILRRDIDTNHHVNNLNYLDFAYEALPEEIYNKVDFNNIDIMYKKETKLNDQIICNCFKENENTIIVEIRNNKEDEVHSVIKLNKK